MLQGCRTTSTGHSVATVPLETSATVAVTEAARPRPLASSYWGQALMQGVWQLSESPGSRRGRRLQWLLQHGGAWCRPSAQQASP